MSTCFTLPSYLLHYLFVCHWLPVNLSHSHCHTVNSSPVSSSHTRLITQSTRHKWAHTIHNKAIRCRTDSTQKVLNTDGMITSGKQTSTCMKGGAENERPEKYQESVDVGNNSDCCIRSRLTLCHHLLMACRHSTVSDRSSAISASYHCAVALSLCHVTTDVFERCVQTLHPNGCLIGLFQLWIDVVMHDYQW